MLINKSDNVDISLADGHKYAARDICRGEDIIKYGFAIGHATCDIKKGAHVHSHNLKTNLSGKLSYTYTPYTPPAAMPSGRSFMGYLRENGDVGIRNDIWIINTVGCVNKTTQRLAAVTGAKPFPHPFGCSQLGGDLEVTQKILRGLVNHPNAGGVLVLGLGCENNNIAAFRRVLGECDEHRVRFLNCQEAGDEIAEGARIIGELENYASHFLRRTVPVSRLRVGLKCGGSDGLSGITANPLVGRFCDAHTAAGGACVLTEVPEMFGAEQLLLKRCVSRAVFDDAVRMINDFKDYFTRHGQVIYENPSPGNKAGGITTLEEKSLGCVQKGGHAAVTDVLRCGDTVRKSGLSLLDGPGNDIVAVTNLAAAGVHMILFTTGRGTPLGGAVPTVKLATNTALAETKPHWIDFDAGRVLGGRELTDELYELVLRIADGEKTQNEKNGYEEMAIFKDGVTL